MTRCSLYIRKSGITKQIVDLGDQNENYVLIRRIERRRCGFAQ